MARRAWCAACDGGLCGHARSLLESSTSCLACSCSSCSLSLVFSAARRSGVFERDLGDAVREDFWGELARECTGVDARELARELACDIFAGEAARDDMREDAPVGVLARDDLADVVPTQVDCDLSMGTTLTTLTRGGTSLASGGRGGLVNSPTRPTTTSDDRERSFEVVDVVLGVAGRCLTPALGVRGVLLIAFDDLGVFVDGVRGELTATEVFDKLRGVDGIELSRLLRPYSFRAPSFLTGQTQCGWLRHATVQHTTGIYPVGRYTSYL